MDKIVVRIDSGLGNQHVLFYEGDVLKDQESVEMNSLIEYLLHECYTQNCYNVHFMGNTQFVLGLIEELSTTESTKYSTNKILIEVN